MAGMEMLASRRLKMVGAGALFAAAVAVAGVLCVRANARVPVDLLEDGGCKDCNVLLITFESLRADHLKCQGYGLDIAPNICAFGETGVLFERAYTPAPVTVPALKAIMSGDLASNENLPELIAHDEVTASRAIATGLDKLGYTTAGFTDHKGLGDLAVPHPNSSPILQGFSSFRNLGEGLMVKSSAKVAAAVEKWLGDHRHEKFFLWTHLFDSHYNWIPGEEAERAFGFRAETCGRIRNGLDIAEIHKIEAGLSPVEIKCLESLYHAEVFETDALVGDILARLDALGLRGRTIVIFAGDHGEEFGERKHIGHEITAYDELLHVPFIVRNPNSARRGRSAEPISTRAIHDYVLAAVRGEGITSSPPLISRTFHYYDDGKTDPGQFRAPPNDFALVRGELKLVLTPRTGAYALYDLAADPGERRDLSRRSPAAAALKGELEEWIRKSRSSESVASSAAVQSYKETVERLKALGYM
jgi:arylsulfatase A-like enzyme